MRLYELRREPDINKKFSTVDSLLKYSSDPKTAVSFSPMMKIGINPQSDWDTPNGVYAYQLSQYKSALSNKDSVEGVFPFGSERPYIFVLDSTASNPLNFDKNMPDSDFTKYIHFMMKRFDLTQDDVDAILTPRLKTRLPTNTQQLYHFIRKTLLNKMGGSAASLGMTNIFNKILRSFGFDAVIDNGHGVLHSGMEPIQVVYLTPSAYKIKDTILNDALHREDRHHVYGRDNKHTKAQQAEFKKRRNNETP